MSTRSALIGGGLGLAVVLGAVSVRQTPVPPASFDPAAVPSAPEAGPDDDAAGDDLPLPPAPPRIAQGDEYERCLSMLSADPFGANGFAEGWAARGGGDGATHCHGLAQVSLGNAERGAEELEKLASRSRGPVAGRAMVYGQAAQAWMMAENPSRSYAATTLALALDPDDPDLLVDRAIAAAGLRRYADAMADLNRALGLDPKRIDALVYRGTARRHLDQLGPARADIDQALATDPENAEALLERGILRQRGGDRAGARADWERVGAVAPDSATADLAQQNLALLDAGPEQRR